MIKSKDKRYYRDEKSGAIIFLETEESKQKQKISRLESEIHTLKDDLQQIKSLLERIVNGR